jgi:hypothetical protein
MVNYKPSGFKKLLSRGVPLHAVDFPCNPLSVGRIVTKFGEARNRQDMIQRVVEAEYNQFARIGAVVILVLQLLADNFSVFCGPKTVGRRFLKVARFAKRPVFTFHHWQHWIFTAVRTNTASDAVESISLSESAISFSADLTVNKTVPCRSRTEHAKALGFQSVITSFGVFQLFSPVLRLVVMLLVVSFASFTVSQPNFFRGFKLAYTLFSHGVNLSCRFAKWLGSLGCLNHLSEPFQFYHPTPYSAMEMAFNKIGRC